MSVTQQLGQVKEVQLPQGTIRYRESGPDREQSARPIVFVHGFLVNGDLWRHVAPLLSSDFRCIVPDWPLGSHELPMPEDADLSPYGVARLVSDFIEALDLEDVVIVGNDSGGAISQILVTNHPQRIGALVLTPCDAFEKFPPFPYNALLAISKIPGAPSVVWHSMRPKIGRLAAFRLLTKTGYDDEIVKSWIRPGLQDKSVRRDGVKFAAGVDSKITMETAKKLESLEIPAMMAWARDCTFFKFDLAERLAAAIPDSRIVEIPDAMTFLPEDQPEALAAAITEFAGSNAVAGVRSKEESLA
ncbi:MAG: alpha/beta fold hydrolase [Solirubrobacterales bacterium]